SLLSAHARAEPYLESPVLVASRASQPAQESTALSRGETIGRYLILGQLGRGGMGVVYRAYDPELHRNVALKLLRAEASDKIGVEEARARLLREAQAMARLSHPNVIAVYDVGTFREQVFVAMEYIDGGTLTSWLNAQPRSWRE